MAPAIITSVCGVLNIQARFASIGSMMRMEDASEIVGVSPSLMTSRIASVVGVVVVPMIASTLSSPMTFLAFWTAVVVSDASSSRMNSTVLPPMDLEHMPTVFFSGMPSDAAGPVAETTTPTLTWALASPASANMEHSNVPPINICFMIPPN